MLSTMLRSEKEKEAKKDKRKKTPKKPRSDSVQEALVPEPVERKRKKRAKVTEYVNLEKARAVVNDPRFVGQGLRAVDGLVECGPCNKHVKFAEVANVEQHCFGKKGSTARTLFQAKPEAEKLKLVHYAKLVGAQKIAEERAVIKTAIAEYQKDVLERSEGLAHAKGSTLDDDVLASRAHVLKDLFSCGIPVTKVGNSRLLRLIEDKHEKLAGVGGLKEMQPTVYRMVMADARAAVKDRRVAIVFDGSKVNFLIEGVLARFLDNDFMPRSICIGAQGVTKSMDNVMIRELLRKHLGDVDIDVKDIVAFLSDSGPPNPTAMREWNESAASMNFGQQLIDEQVFWLPCLMHAMSNCGQILRKQLHLTKQFMSGFKTMTNESDAARELWAEVTGKPCPGLAEKSFWSWWQTASRYWKCGIELDYSSSRQRSGLCRKRAWRR